jgi:LPXTG-motif cell wall-anchored protein
LLALGLCGAALNGQQPAATIPVQMGYTVRPDTVVIGQPFNLLIKIHAPKGVRFEFPAGPDTAMQNGVRPIELRGEKVVSLVADTAIGLYHLVAWDIGTQPLRIADVHVAAEGVDRVAPLSGASVFVRSILPTDTALRVPKPPRPLIVLPVFNWWPWIALLGALLLAALGWWLWRRYKNRPAVPVDPYVRAQREFARIEQQRLLEDGRAAEYFAAMVDVVREYLAARVPGVRRSDTSTELLRTMQPREGVEAELPALLDRADMVKFARAGISAQEAAPIRDTARAIVDHVEIRLNPESAVAKRAAAAKGKAA